MKRILAVLLLVSITLLNGCGGGSSSLAPATTVSGVAASGNAIANATITLIDTKGVTKTSTTSTTGAYSITATGLFAPFVVKVDAGSGKFLYSFTEDVGTANINPFSDLIVRSAAGNISIESAHTTIKANIALAKAQLQTTFQAIMTTYGIPGSYDQITSSYVIGNAIDKLFDNINVSVSTNGNTVTITNAATGTTIYTASINANGAFSGLVVIENLPQPTNTGTGTDTVTVSDALYGCKNYPPNTGETIISKPNSSMIMNKTFYWVWVNQNDALSWYSTFGAFGSIYFASDLTGSMDNIYPIQSIAGSITWTDSMPTKVKVAYTGDTRYYQICAAAPNYYVVSSASTSQPGYCNMLRWYFTLSDVQAFNSVK